MDFPIPGIRTLLHYAGASSTGWASGGRFFVSAESEWLLTRAKQSLLAAAVADWKLIPGGVDLAIFSPGSRLAARRELGLSSDQHIILSVANLGTENKLKDFSTIKRALVELERHDPGRHLMLLAIGADHADGVDEHITFGITIRRVDYLRSPDRLAEFYRAADVFVHSAIEEPFGLSVAEALACGTPVVTASRGGVLAIVAHGRNGLIVPLRDPAALGEAIGSLLNDPSRRMTMGRAAADFARKHLDSRTTISALHSWCVDIHEQWNTPTSP